MVHGKQKGQEVLQVLFGITEKCVFAAWKCRLEGYLLQMFILLFTSVWCNIRHLVYWQRCLSVSVYHLSNNMCSLTSLGSFSSSLIPCVSSAFQMLELIRKMQEERELHGINFLKIHSIQLKMHLLYHSTDTDHTIPYFLSPLHVGPSLCYAPAQHETYIISFRTQQPPNAVFVTNCCLICLLALV